MATTLSGQVDLGSATEGTALVSNTDVASFTDDNLSDTASAFTATIDWGDGTTTSGTIVGSNGSFTVEGGHTYADEGFPTAAVNVTRTADNTQLSMIGTVPVADADNLTGHSAPTITANPNQALTNVTVATFTDTYTGNTASDFTTSIDWGDGTTTTTGVLSGSGGNFTVTGSHTYTTAGQFTITTFMNDDGPDAAVGVATTTAGIGFGGSGVPHEVTELTASGTLTVATFSDNANLPASDYTATIDWGDGTTTTGTVGGSSGSFSVTGSHTYADEGNFTSTTNVTRTTDTVQIHMSGAMTVDEGDLLAASGTTINGDLALNNVKVATFTDVLTAAVASDFVATIDWGDGTTTAGTISGSGGAFSISGTHTYAQGGQYIISTEVNDDVPGTAQDTAQSTANVGMFNGAGATINGTEGTPASGTTATFSDGDTADTASAFSATIDWGDGTTTPATVTGSNGSFSVQGTHAYSDEGNFTTTSTVTRTADSSHLTITGSVSAAEADSLILAPNSFTANPGQAFNGQVATFSDTFTGNTASDFIATINWGDGTFSAGTVTGSGASFTVSGAHTYTSGGSFSVTTTASDDAPGTATASGTGTATVNLGGTEVLSTATEHVAISNAVIAIFNDSAADPATAFSATINWGDGTTSAGSVSGATGPGSFTVIGSHTYADEGNFQASATLTRTADQVTSTVSGSIAVAEHDSLTGQAVAISGAAHHALTNVTVATFTDTDTVSLANDFVATIDWGDGTTTAGTITGSNGAFAVNGSHTYATAGHDNVTVTMSDDAPGTATATATSTAVIGSGSSSQNDFNADGFSDFLWQTDGGNLAIWEMNGFQISAADYTRLGSSQVGLPGPDWHIVDTGDFDGDGKADILWRTDSGATAIWEMDGTHIKTADFIRNGSTVVGAPGPDWHELGAADFDGDSKADILWRTDSGALAIWEMDGTHIKTADFIRNGSTAVGVPAPDWKIVGVGDFDGDGNNDLLWETGGGQLAVWQMNGTHIKSADYVKNGVAITGIPGSDWHVADVGDFDGDGKADILWRVGAAPSGGPLDVSPGGGQVAIWEMNGNQIKAADYTRNGSTAVGAPGNDWHLLGSDDYNGDGMNDILWRTDAGQLAIWEMNGTHILAADYTKIGAANVGAPGADWHLFEHHYDLV